MVCRGFRLDFEEEPPESTTDDPVGWITDGGKLTGADTRPEPGTGTEFCI
jgi:hypothetical protein